MRGSHLIAVDFLQVLHNVLALVMPRLAKFQKDVLVSIVTHIYCIHGMWVSTSPIDKGKPPLIIFFNLKVYYFDTDIVVYVRYFQGPFLD